MEAFKTVIWIINIFSSLAIIALVLMQHGKGADAGASFGGSGSAQGVFGSSGNANFLTRMTAICAMIFFASCLALGFVNSKSSNKVGGLDFSNVQQTQTASTPVAPSHVAPTMENVVPQAASVEAASQAKADVNGAAIAAGAGAAAATAKVVADKVSDKKAEAKANSKKASNTEKSKSSKPAAKAQTKKTDKSSK